jgi:hypothetical protein
MTLDDALRGGWCVVALDFEPRHALVERRRPDGLKERALALRLPPTNRRRPS